MFKRMPMLLLLLMFKLLLLFRWNRLVAGSRRHPRRPRPSRLEDVGTSMISCIGRCLHVTQGASRMSDLLFIIVLLVL